MKQADTVTSKEAKMKVTGSLQNRNGIYRMMVRVQKLDSSTEQKAKSTGIKVVGKTQRETKQNKQQADILLAKWIEELETGTEGCADTLFIFRIEEWLERKKRRVRVDTFEAYQSYYDTHIKPYFEPKKLKLSEITPRTIQRYVDQKEREGLSPNSIVKHLVILNGVFKEAIALQEATLNPCESATITRSDETFHGTAYELEDAKKLLKAIEGDAIEPAVYLSLYLGLRRSEVVGLRWKDVDFEKSIVRIRNTVVQCKTVSELEKTKTRASKRDLYLPNGLKLYLLAWRAKAEEYRKLFGSEYRDSGHICQWPDGTSYRPDYVTMRFQKVLAQNGLPRIRFHDLRHTAGSLLVNQGQSIKQVQEFLGHEKASTTLDIYTHLSFESKKDTAQKLDELLSDAG